MAPWSGSPPNQAFSRTDGVRTGDDVFAQQAAAPVDIEPTLMDTHDTDLKDGINACLKKDGGNTASADLPMGGFKHTNVAEAAARTQYARFSQVQDNKGQYIATVGGTADAITLTPSPAITAYAAGQRFSFIAGSTNTGAATVNVSSVGAKDIKRNDGSATALAAGDIVSGTLVDIEYNGTAFLFMSAGAAPTFTNEGLRVLDTNASHYLTIKPGSNLTADKTLTLTTGDADRTLTLQGDATLPAGTALVAGNNLSDVSNAGTARTNLAVLGVASNLSDLNNAGTARTNLGLGTIATQDADDVSITGGTVAGVTLSGITAVSSTGVVTANSGTAPPANGSTSVGVKISSTANLGIFVGSGAPSLNAANGSLYLQTDGIANQAFYVRRSGGWVAMQEVS